MKVPYVMSALALAIALLGQSACAGDMSTLLQSAKTQPADEAYQLLSAEEAQFAGEPDFDYALGVAALESGHYTAASFALERVVANEPDNAAAYLDLGRAYYGMGDLDAAKTAFDEVASHNPPEAVRKLLQSYQGQLTPPASSELKAMIYIGTGHDSNANGGLSQDIYTFPAAPALPVTMPSTALAKSDNYAFAGAQLSYRTVISNGLVLDASLNAAGKSFDQLDTQDSHTIGLGGGLTWQTGDNRLRLGVNTSKEWLNHQHYVTTDGARIDWSHLLDSQSEISLYGNYNRYDYTSSGSDVHRVTLGSRFMQSFEDLPYKPLLQSGFYAGKTLTDAGTPDYVGNRFFGFMLGGIWHTSEQTDIYLSGAYERRIYSADTPAYLARRKDNQWDIRLGMNYRFYPRFTLTPQISWTRNGSNQDISQYQRTRFDLTLKYDFQ